MSFKSTCSSEGFAFALALAFAEAAFALGLRPNRTMNLVILLQALRVIIPPLISQYLNLTKNSSLAIAVGYMDLRGTLGGTTLNQTGRELEAIVLMMLIYLALSLIISAILAVIFCLQPGRAVLPTRNAQAPL